jgi:carboxyl-terminal processing protease
MSDPTEPRSTSGVSTVLRWILPNLLLGLAGGLTLGWGPLAAPTAAIVALGLLGALGVGAVAWWSDRAGRRRWVLWGHAAIFTYVALAALIPLYRIGAIAPPGETRQGNFRRLRRALDVAYPYFEQKGVDWDAVTTRYASQVAEAPNDEVYWGVVARMLAELNDGHTGVTSPSAYTGLRTFAGCRDLEGAIVVDRVGEAAQRAGLARGDVVLAVDGRPIEEALAAVPAVLHVGSTPEQRRAAAAQVVLSTRGEVLTVAVEDAAGERRTVDLIVPGDPPPAPPPASQAALITGERLRSGLGLIRIPTFSGGERDLVAEFDAALDPLMDSPGLILNLRGNGGGSTFISDRIAGRFLTRPFTYGREQFRLRLPQRGWRPHFDYRVAPRGATYTGPLVLLIDDGCYSTAENFIVALVDSGRATTVGRTTGGSSGNSLPFALTGGARARFSTGDFRRNDGTPIEGLGTAPDVPVAWTIEDLREDRDPDLNIAVDLLLAVQAARPGD